MESLENIIFQTLSHPIRRKILRILELRNSLSFSELAEEVKVADSSILSFHLEKLGILIIKEGKSYRLSKIGKVALRTEEFLRSTIVDAYPELLGNSDIIVLNTNDISILLSFLFCLLISILSIHFLLSFLKIYSLVIPFSVIIVFLLLFIHPIRIKYIIKKNCVSIKKRIFIFDIERKIYGKLISYMINKSLIDAITKSVSISLYCYNRGIIKNVNLKNIKINEKVLRRLDVLVHY